MRLIPTKKFNLTSPSLEEIAKGKRQAELIQEDLIRPEQILEFRQSLASEPPSTALDDGKPTAREVTRLLVLQDAIEAAASLTSRLGSQLEVMDEQIKHLLSNRTTEPVSSMSAGVLTLGAPKSEPTAVDYPVQFPIANGVMLCTRPQQPGEPEDIPCPYPDFCLQVASCIRKSNPVPDAKVQAQYHRSKGR